MLRWLIALGPTSLDRMHVFESSSSAQLCKPGARAGHARQAGHHDRALRRHEDVYQVARCIIGNPLRAGSVMSSTILSGDAA